MKFAAAVCASTVVTVMQPSQFGVSFGDLEILVTVKVMVFGYCEAAMGTNVNASNAASAYFMVSYNS